MILMVRLFACCSPFWGGAGCRGPWEEARRLQRCVPFSSEGAHAAGGRGDTHVGAGSHLQGGADLVSGEVSKPPQHRATSCVCTKSFPRKTEGTNLPPAWNVPSG